MAKSKVWINPNPDTPFQTPHSIVKPLMGQASSKEKKKNKDIAQSFKSPWLRRVFIKVNQRKNRGERKNLQETKK